MAGIGALVWKLMQDAQHNIVFLSDGSQLVFCGLSEGQTHTYDFATLRDRIVRRLPGRLAGKFQRNTIAWAGPEAGEIGFWFLRQGGIPWTNTARPLVWRTIPTRKIGPVSIPTVWNATANSIIPTPNSFTGPAAYFLKPRPATGLYAVTGGGRLTGPDSLLINLKDEHGDGEPGLWQFSRSVGTFYPRGTPLYWKSNEIPLHSRMLVLCIYEYRDTAGLKCIGRIRVPNPLYGRAPQKTSPAPLPWAASSTP